MAQTIPRKDPLLSPTETDWSYVAAMMDGEGSFSVTRTTIKDRKGRPYNAFDCKVMVSNTSEVLMKWIQNRFGGTYRPAVKHISKKAKANGQKSLKLCFRWTVEGYENQVYFILRILPYLVIKLEQAKIALEFAGMKGKSNPSKRLELHYTMKALNKGESVTTNTPNASCSETDVKIESDLIGDYESGPGVIPEASTVKMGDYINWKALTLIGQSQNT